MMLAVCNLHKSRLLLISVINESFNFSIHGTESLHMEFLSILKMNSNISNFISNKINDIYYGLMTNLCGLSHNHVIFICISHS